ncbi:MAG: toll/interleukin-1 receptor domain-containing protein [Anaerolineae bacterium]|nr:toll/interleukin-1 receptor domain-containing protein [Anaerolineae bacterium]
MQVFICYARADMPFALQLIEDLNDYDLTVWMDMQSIPHGANWDIEVQKGLDSSDLMLVLLTPSSVASQNVADEWSYFIEKNKPIVPLMVELCEVPFRLSRRQRVDFTGDYKTGFEQLITAIGSPALRDPEATQRVRNVARDHKPLIPDAAPAARDAVRPAPAASSFPGARTPIAPEVGVKMFPIIWSDSYHWFNGMGSDAQQGDIMIDRQEVKLIPHAKPITTIPLRSLVSAQLQRSVDHYLKVTYYDSQGAFKTMIIMGAQKERRKTIAEEILNLLKLVTGRSLT